MKKSIFILALLFAGSVTVMAQGGGNRPRLTVEERVQRMHHAVDSAFKLEASRLAQSDSAFAKYYRAQDKLREEMRAGGGQPDFQAMREKMQPLMDERDKELKVIYGDDLYKKWKEELEPALRPRGGPGGGNR
jgi:periplasmic protein CpxP/Spy